jgi:hypothetical protein
MDLGTKNNMVLSFSDAKKISISDYLLKLGHEPAKIRGNDYWYRSPLREERDASFKVNKKLNVWYDHGSGEGGTLLDLGAKIHGCSLMEFVELLSRDNFSFHRPPQKLDLIEESKVELISANSITDQALIQYLEQRKIDPGIADIYCKQIHFKIKDRDYMAIGFPNRSGGYELRNSWFKGSSSPKDITTIHRGQESLCVTEGLFDFLSLHQVKDKQIQKLVGKSDFLVLNSIAFVKKALPIMSAYKVQELFLDNDQAAKKAKEVLNDAGLGSNDRSEFYSSFKDLNEYLVKGESNNSPFVKSPRLRI